MMNILFILNFSKAHSFKPVPPALNSKTLRAEAEEDIFGEHWMFASGTERTIHHLGNKTFCVPEDGVIDLR